MNMNAARHVEVRVTQRLNAPPHRVFAAWLDPKVAGQWLFATASRPMAFVTIDARVNGSFRFLERSEAGAAEYSGVYVEISAPRRLVFTLTMAGQSMDPSRVIVEIAPSNGGSEVNLIHEWVPLNCASRTEGRWSGILYGLGVTLEAGLQALHLEGIPHQATLSKTRSARRL